YNNIDGHGALNLINGLSKSSSLSILTLTLCQNALNEQDQTKLNQKILKVKRLVLKYIYL
ncbi:hypothetical protein ABPG74_021065, partial [Tetrahymena malaccensis]